MNNNDAVQDFDLTAAVKDIELLKEHFLSLKSKVVGLPIDSRTFHVLIRQMADTKDEIALIENDIQAHFSSCTNADKAKTPFLKAPKKVSDIVSKYGHETQIWNKKR